MNDNFKIAKNFFEIGEKYFSEKNFEEADKNFNLSLKYIPDRVSTLINLGLCKIKLKKFDECLAIINKLYSLKDNSFDFMNLQSLYYGETSQFKKAIDVIESMLLKKNISNQDLSNLYNYQGIAYSKLKQYHKSIKLQQKSIDANNSNYDALCNLGFNNLTIGNFQEGWKYYEYRLLRNNLNISKYPKDISELKNKKVLIRPEQGLGDIIQFSRFLPELLNYTNHIDVIIPRALENLFNYKNLNFISHSAHILNYYDYEIFIGSLPYLLKKYEKFENEGIAINEDIFNSKTALKSNINIFQIGLAWSGNPKFRYDHLRSLDLRKLQKLFSLRKLNLKFFCLQKDLKNHDKDFLDKMKVDYLGNLNFYNLAKKIINFDLIISSDTSILHLASSLGIKTYGMISYVPDWRWMADGEHSNWYKSLKLYRQPKLFDWDDVIDRIVRDLKIKTVN